MLKEGKIVFDESRDREFVIPESVESLYAIMYKKLYERICEKGNLEFERTKSKEEIMQVIQGLLKMGQGLNHSIQPSDEMLQYFAKEFDVECIVEFINRRKRSNLWEDRRHDPRYIEQDLPLASADVIEKMSESVLEWGKIEEEISRDDDNNISHKK